MNFCPQQKTKICYWEVCRQLDRAATEKGLDKTGYRLATNCGEGAGQTINHFHIHLLAGENLTEETLAK